ncbi:MAG TPA: dTDP-4-dehydrorhamnose reductase [Aestuariivirgaceae bacterium]|nr:dTDP-4-dehydrorhamnose reductase [Aestuariivirgaceae bacterium]
MSVHRVLVIGRSGQVASALAGRQGSAAVDYVCVGRPAADLASRQSLAAAIARHRPALVVNAGAWTAVDLAESQVDSAFDVNAEGPARLARFCRTVGIPLVHLSTDYVFDGRSTRPYREADPVAPLNAYGRTKEAGERAVRSEIGEHIILRLGWVFDATHGNFVTTILRLAGERTTLDVVHDQTGTPSFAADIAGAIDLIARRILGGTATWGTFHVANGGHTTRYEQAREIVRLAARHGLREPDIRPILTPENEAARRPRYSVLDTTRARDVFGVDLPPWQDALARCIERRFAPGAPSRAVSS